MSLRKLLASAVVATALLTAPTDAAHLVAFYRRVEPPGWWTRTAAAAGASPTEPLRHLVHGATSIVCAATIAYALLFAGGLWLLQPERWATAAAAVAAAVLLVPIWWRLHERGPLPAGRPTGQLR